MMEDVNMLWDVNDTDEFMEDIEQFITDAVDAMSSSSSTSSSDSSLESEDSEGTEKPADFVKILDQYSPLQFKAHMRIQKTTAQYLTDRFSSSRHLPENNHGGKECVNGKKSVYMYIWYISNSITFRQLAVLFNVCRSTAWLTVKRVTSFFISIGHEFVKWPQGAEINGIQRKFQEKKGIPGVIGAIDCTHINIKAPNNSKESYFDRKQNYSLVFQAVVDADMKFISISCGEPGSLHDFRVLRRSDLYLRAETNADELFPNNSFILGDSAYPPSRWIVPPFKDCGNLSENQKKFNYIHSATRIIVENAFGRLKTRFRRLLKFTEQTNLETLTNVIVSACVLHNICILMDDLHESPESEQIASQNDTGADMYNIEFTEGSNRRDILFNYLLEENII